MAYIEDKLFAQIVKHCILPCVDFIPVQKKGNKYYIGLILRATGPEAGKYCLMGGIIQKGETVSQAIDRHLRKDINIKKFNFYQDIDEFHPLFVQRYFQKKISPLTNYGYDPTKEAFTPTYLIQIASKPKPMQEAKEFVWFSKDQIPPKPLIGYNHSFAIKEAFKYLIHTRGCITE